MGDDEWVKAATADDSLVVELLLRLNHLHSSPPLPPPPPPPPSSLRLDWTVRQPRSKSISLKPTIARTSPTTPLSWSAATSHSGGATGSTAVDCSDESSRPPPGSNSSKVIGKSEATPTKRSRKKKTMSELKEEELLLLTERKDLKRNIEILLVTLGKKQAMNENLKRMKMDLTMQPAIEGAASFASEETIPDQTLEKLATNAPDPFTLPPSVTGDDTAAIPLVSPPNKCFEVQTEVTCHEYKFVVPDLNVALEECGAEDLCGDELRNDQE